MKVRVTDLGDACVVLEYPARVDPQVNSACVAVADAVSRAGVAGVRDVTATYYTVAVHLDPTVADRDAVAELLMRAAETVGEPPAVSGRLHELPVCYGGEWGPDLTDVARFGQCAEEEVIRLHSDQVYRVYMMGFLPGFAYLGQVDDRIRMGRRETPRLRVPAGAVGIAGPQTGVYPVESPGGWRIIGQSWVRPYDERRPNPFLFRAGDEVRFVPVSVDEYRRMVTG
jgi:KipI family sensor histidine kinase inhibitor